MTKRPVSLTVIICLEILSALFGIYSAATMGSNPIMLKMQQQTHVPLIYNQVSTVVGVIISLIVAYGIFKAQPWSRVLFVVWGIISLILGFYTIPMKAALVVSLIILIIFSIFLFGEKANDWFSARGFMLKREG